MSTRLLLDDISLQTHHVDSTLIRRGNDRFHVVSTWNPRGVFVGLPPYWFAVWLIDDGKLISDCWLMNNNKHELSHIAIVKMHSICLFSIVFGSLVVCVWYVNALCFLSFWKNVISFPFFWMQYLHSEGTMKRLWLFDLFEIKIWKGSKCQILFKFP